MAADSDHFQTRAPLFLISFRQRDELALATERAGWATVAARRLENLERRFLLSEARIAIVDARGAYDEGLEALRILAEPAEANFAALLVLVSRNDVEGIDAGYTLGATHFLVSPFGDEELRQALRFADRHVARVRGTASDRDRKPVAPLSWAMARDDDRVRLSPRLATLLALESDGPPRAAFLESLGEDGMREAAAALEKLRQGDELAVFAHKLPGLAGERLVHTLSAGDEAISARVERPDQPFVARNRRRRDRLTGLSDTHGAMQWMRERIAEGASEDEGDGPDEAKSDRSAFILILLAVHRFDLLSQGFGDRAGDAALQTVARRIERFFGKAMGKKRLLARIAGAEFALGIAAPATLDEGGFFARQLIGILEHPFVFEDQTIEIRVRAGVVEAGPDERDEAAILRHASMALSRAREAEGEPLCVMDADARRSTAHVRQLEADLIPAIEADEIEILFQPQVSIASGAIVGVEALSRWQHPVLGELGAQALFAAAERADYLSELSHHVQRKALEAAALWPEALAGLRIAINVTAEDMARPDFVDHAVALGRDTGIGAKRITLEITETGLIADLSQAATELAELRQSGFRIAIDDFGTGYSNFAYLKSLPLDYLKIDSALSGDIGGDRRERIVVRGVIEMARSLGLTVIAEGVETEEQLTLLAQEGCGLYQGFLCSPPVDSATLIGLIAAKAG